MKTKAILLSMITAMLSFSFVEKQDNGTKRVSKAIILASGGLKAEIENFDFDFKYEVLSFDVTAKMGEFENSYHSNSSRFTADQIKLIKDVKSGTKVYFENIKAKGSDGSIRDVGALVVRVI